MAIMAQHDSGTCQWCQGGEHFFAPTKHYPQAHVLAPAGTRWVMLTKRTEDPKLAWLETHLRDHGIPSRRRGSSFHAPILEVPKDRADAAWKLLGAKIGRRVLDDIPDDDPMFQRAFGNAAKKRSTGRRSSRRSRRSSRKSRR
jgi:hypothetical protein